MSEELCNIAKYINYRAQEIPETTAIEVPHRNERCNFKELEEKTNGVANTLIKRGIIQGTKVLIMVKPGLDLIISVFALFKIGAVPIIIDPGMGIKNFLKCIKNTKPDALIAIPLVYHLLRQIPLRIKVPILEESRPFTMAQTKSNDLAAIVFTSGSTGAPKGVCYTHGIFEAQLKLIKDTFKIQPGEVDLPLLPIFALFNPALGMTTIIPDMNPSKPANANPRKIVDAIKKYQVTNSFGSPVLWRIIADYLEKQKAPSPLPLKRILMAGCSVPISIFDRYKKLLPYTTIYAPYGSTEALPLTSISEPIERLGAGSCLGRVLPGNQIKILDLDNGKPLPTGQIGEIVATGSIVTKSYYNNEYNEKLKIIEDNTIWHRMGDLGYFDNDNNLWFCGRKAECISINNQKYFTDCLEGIINKHEAVLRSALININNELAIIIQPKKWIFRKKKLIQKITHYCQNNELLKDIKHIFLKKNFPVDVRHNAKIHRLTLTKEFNTKCGY